MRMIFASWLSDLANLTWLVLGTFIFVLALVFHNELKDVLRRLSNLRFKRHSTEVGAELNRIPGDDTQADVSEDSVGQEGSPVGEVQEEEPQLELESDDPSAIRSLMLKSYAAGDVDAGDRQFDRLNALESNPIERKKDSVRRLAGRYMGGSDGDVEGELRVLLNDEEVASFVHHMLGRCMRHIGKNSNAAEEFQNAFEKAIEPRDQVNAAVERAVSLADAGEADIAIAELEKKLITYLDSQSQVQLWDGLARVYEQMGEKELKAFALHQVANQAGNSAAKWFDAGYAYGDAGNVNLSLLSLHCYRTALRLDITLSGSKNNLGVLLDGLKLPILGMSYYREAANEGHTLGMANIAQAYLGAGFAEDAKRLVTEAARNPNPHKNVASTIAEIESRRAEEEKKFTRLEGSAGKASEFMIELSSARWRDEELDDGWFLGGMAVEVDVNGEEVEFAWKEETPLPYRRFLGRKDGAALVGKFEREAQAMGQEKTVWGSNGSGYGVLSDSGSVIRFVRISSGETEYLELTRMPDESPE